MLTVLEQSLCQGLEMTELVLPGTRLTLQSLLMSSGFPEPSLPPYILPQFQPRSVSQSKRGWSLTSPQGGGEASPGPLPRLDDVSRKQLRAAIPMSLLFNQLN